MCLKGPTCFTIFGTEWLCGGLRTLTVLSFALPTKVLWKTLHYGATVFRLLPAIACAGAFLAFAQTDTSTRAFPPPVTFTAVRGGVGSWSEEYEVCYLVTVTVQGGMKFPAWRRPALPRPGPLLAALTRSGLAPWPALSAPVRSKPASTGNAPAPSPVAVRCCGLKASVLPDDGLRPPPNGPIALRRMDHQVSVRALA